MSSPSVTAPSLPIGVVMSYLYLGPQALHPLRQLHHNAPLFGPESPDPHGDRGGGTRTHTVRILSPWLYVSQRLLLLKNACKTLHFLAECFSSFTAVAAGCRQTVVVFSPRTSPGHHLGHFIPCGNGMRRVVVMVNPLTGVRSLVRRLRPRPRAAGSRSSGRARGTGTRARPRPPPGP